MEKASKLSSVDMAIQKNNTYLDPKNIFESSDNGFRKGDSFTLKATSQSNDCRNDLLRNNSLCTTKKRPLCLGNEDRSFSVQPLEMNSTTPHQTPFQRKAAVITRSSGVKNPYMRKFTTSMVDEKSRMLVTPASINYLNNSSQFTPMLDSKAGVETLTIDSINTKREKFSSAVPKVLDYDDSNTNTSIKIQKMKYKSLEELISLYGPMQNDTESSLKFGINPILLEISADNSVRLRFDSSGKPTGFAGQSFGLHSCYGDTKDLKNILVTMGCDDALLSDVWISNHFRWIVWKLASIERRFSHLLSHSYLTYTHVADQLKRRYDKEICQAKRPILRKVLNRDIAASKLMILLVSKISVSQDTKNKFNVELSDGWYAVPTILDTHLQQFVCSGKIKVGSKLVVCNAILEGAEEGIDPLDRHYPGIVRSGAIRLKICANSTRLCKWNAKLGMVAPSKRILSHGGVLGIKSLSDVIPGGGSIPSINLVICKTYPLLYKENIIHPNSQTQNDTITLTATQNEIRQKKFEEERQRFIEMNSEAIKREAIQVCKFSSKTFLTCITIILTLILFMIKRMLTNLLQLFGKK